MIAQKIIALTNYLWSTTIACRASFDLFTYSMIVQPYTVEFKTKIESIEALMKECITALASSSMKWPIY